MTTKLTSVWFAHVGWAKSDQDEADARKEHVAFPIPYDSHESALWALRSMAENFWNEWARLPVARPWGAYDEQGIRETLADGCNNGTTLPNSDVVYDDWVLVEIREVQIVNHTATGWRTLNLKAADDALRIPSPPGSYHPSTHVPAHRFQSGLSANNEVTRCVVSHKGKDYFGPWRGDEASALTAALLLIQDKE